MMKSHMDKLYKDYNQTKRDLGLTSASSQRKISYIEETTGPITSSCTFLKKDPQPFDNKIKQLTDTIKSYQKENDFAKTYNGGKPKIVASSIQTINKKNIDVTQEYKNFSKKYSMFSGRKDDSSQKTLKTSYRDMPKKAPEHFA
jgi:hypothetical protein